MNYSPIEEVALTQKLIRIESTNPGAFEYKVSDFVYDFLAQTGADVLRHEVKDGRCNIVATLKGEQSGPRLVYICHQDTVPLGDGWHYDPLAAEIIDSKMYGRGSCDMKSGLAAGMLAFRSIAAMGKKLKHDFLFIASMDEEDIMIGADKLIADGIVRADDYVLDAEPTNGAIKVAHKGKTWFRLDAKGVACHASTPEKGSDAVAALSEVICAINRRLRALPVHPVRSHVRHHQRRPEPEHRARRVLLHDRYAPDTADDERAVHPPRGRGHCRGLCERARHVMHLHRTCAAPRRGEG